MENPDPTKFIAIINYVAALKTQQAEFDKAVEAKSAELEDLQAANAALTEFKTRTEAGIVQVIATIQNPEIDSETTAKTILAIIAQGTAPEAERVDAEVDKQLAELLTKRSKPLTPDDLANLVHPQPDAQP